jgi:hypothetical protein
MCHAVNEAIFRMLKDGIARSTSLMVPYPWMLHDTHFLVDIPIEPGGNYVRQTDLDLLMSEQARDIVRDEGIIHLDYRASQAVWKVK